MVERSNSVPGLSQEFQRQQRRWHWRSERNDLQNGLFAESWY